jgi:hypothetical protein
MELISFHTVSEFTDCVSKNRIGEVYASLIYKNATIDGSSHHFISSSLTFFKNNRKYRLLLENDCGKMDDSDEAKKKVQIESTRYSIQFRALCNVLGKTGLKIIRARVDEEVTAIQDSSIVEEEMQGIYKEFNGKLKDMQEKVKLDESKKE